MDRLPEDKRRVSDAEYAARYEREVRRYAERFAARPVTPGAASLTVDRWVRIDDGLHAAARWSRYASAHDGLKVQCEDGTWCDWDSRGAA